MSNIVTKILAEQRRRMLASILRAAEEEHWYGLLSAEERERHRRNVVNSINIFYDLCRDIIKVSDDDGVRNDEAVKLLAAVHTSQRALEQQLREALPREVV